MKDAKVHFSLLGSSSNNWRLTHWCWWQPQCDNTLPSLSVNLSLDWFITGVPLDHQMQVPSILPLETLHNRLSLKQMDMFLESFTQNAQDLLARMESPSEILRYYPNVQVLMHQVKYAIWTEWSHLSMNLKTAQQDWEQESVRGKNWRKVQQEPVQSQW